MIRIITLLSVIIFNIFGVTVSHAADTDRMALVCLSVANLRSRPAHSAELASQLTMGTPVSILATDGSWYEIETPEGYKGWMHRSSLARLSGGDFDRWRKSPRMIVTSIPETECYLSASGDNPREIVSDLVNGCIVEAANNTITDGRCKIILPDKREAWVSADAVEPLDQWAEQPYTPDKIVDMAMSLMGRPYLWGGTSTKGLDCSGLTKVCHFANGIILRRDASQQAKTGRRIENSDTDSLTRGDLLFFGNASTGRVTHVAIYDADGHYVHSSQRVKVSQLSADDPHYGSTDYLHAVRIGDSIGTKGITRLKEHPWYFSIAK